MFLSRIIENNVVLSKFVFISCSLLCRGRVMISERHLLNNGNVFTSKLRKGN